MPTVQYRLTEEFDIPAMARIRALEWGTEQYWEERIAQYVKCEHDPQQAQTSRVGYVALEGDSRVGFIAGHLTRRYGCDGELQWINVIPRRRGGEVAAQLLRLLAGWFIEQHASRVCVDVEPANTAARRFYKRHGAEDLNKHWSVWSDIKVLLG